MFIPWIEAEVLCICRECGELRGERQTMPFRLMIPHPVHVAGMSKESIAEKIRTMPAITLDKERCHWSVMAHKSDTIFAAVSVHTKTRMSVLLEKNYRQTWSCIGEFPRLLSVQASGTRDCQDHRESCTSI